MSLPVAIVVSTAIICLTVFVTAITLKSMSNNDE